MSDENHAAGRAAYDGGETGAAVTANFGLVTIGLQADPGSVEIETNIKIG